MNSHGNYRTISDEIAGIKELLQYVSVDVASGIIVWSSPRKGISVGDSGGTMKDGYCVIKFRKKYYRRHRIIFYVANGYLPAVVDHKNGIEFGDGIDNLQEATQQENVRKQKKKRNSASGKRGVIFDKRRNNYQARIVVDGKQIFLGSYDTPEKASEVYNEKAKELFGDFYVE